MSLKCQFTGVPAPVNSWHKNGEPLKTNSRISVNSFDDEACLTIDKIEVADEGEYSCKISNSQGFEICKCQLEVEKPKPKVQPVKINEEKPLIKEESIVKPAPVQIPVPEPVVEKKPEVVQEPIENKLEKAIESKLENIAQAIQQEEKKVVTPEPVVEKKPEQKGTQKIEPIPEPVIPKPEPVVEIKEEKTPAAPKPILRFDKHLKSQNLLEGELMILECTVQGPEPLEITWLRNNKEIPENPDFLKQRIDNLFRLTVNEIFPEDSGIFSAELFSEALNKSKLSSCSIVVQGMLIF